MLQDVKNVIRKLRDFTYVAMKACYMGSQRLDGVDLSAPERMLGYPAASPSTLMRQCQQISTNAIADALKLSITSRSLAGPM